MIHKSNHTAKNPESRVLATIGAAEITVQDVENWAEVGFDLIEEGQIVEAHDIFYGIVALAPATFLGYLGEAKVCFARNRPDVAESLLVVATRCPDCHPEAHNTLGDLRLQLGKYEAARSAFASAANARPQDNAAVEHAQRMLRVLDTLTTVVPVTRPPS